MSLNKAFRVNLKEISCLIDTLVLGKLESVGRSSASSRKKELSFSDHTLLLRESVSSSTISNRGARQDDNCQAMSQ
jgi:hypothetical protein